MHFDSMSKVGRIRLRDICDLTTNCRNASISPEIGLATEANVNADYAQRVFETPTATTKKSGRKTVVATTPRKKSFEESATVSAVKTETAVIATTTKKSVKGLRSLPGQQRIDAIFKSCVKTYKIEPELTTKNQKLTIMQNEKVSKEHVTRSRRGRKRLFKERTNLSDSSTTVTENSLSDQLTPPPSYRKKSARKKVTNVKDNNAEADLVIVLSSEDENELQSKAGKKLAKKSKNVQNSQLKRVKAKRTKETENKETTKLPTRKRGVTSKANNSELKNVKREKTKEIQNEETTKLTTRKRGVTTKTSNTCTAKNEVIPDTLAMVSIPVASPEAIPIKSNRIASPKVIRNNYCNSIENEPSVSTSWSTKSHSSKGGTKLSIEAYSSDTKHDAIPTIPPMPANENSKRVRKLRLCPAYKVVDGTTFAVDAFQYGQIVNVTHYFLTHYHADHYVGLTRKFSMPLYLSPITARLVRAFIKVEDKYINEIDLNRPEVIAGIEVTAIDANHCPGAVMFVFKFSTGKCILHTGDFRACPQMESEPIFWNNWIDTIYLDTTYISNKYKFCPQSESIDNAINIVKNFLEKHASARILLVCGAYMIGKEKFWGTLAQHFDYKVWTEKNRSQALHAMDLIEVRDRLCDHPLQAQLHVISIGKLSYFSLVEYFKPFEKYFDALLAIRPSGWEKHSRPQLRGRINIVGIEYSEHSSHDELERFVTYLKPNKVISTVPVANNPMITAKVPIKWYKYNTLTGKKCNFQPSITSYIKMLPKQKATKPKMNFTTPTKSINETSYDCSQLSMQPMDNCFEENEKEEQLTVPATTSTHISTLPAKDVAQTIADSDDTVKLNLKQIVEETVEGSAGVLVANMDAYDDWM